TDRPRPAAQSFRGTVERFLLPPALDRRLQELSRRHGATLFMTLLAAFQVLLHRHTGQEDIALGSPIAGRNRPEIEALAGFFVNTLVMRGDLRGDPAFDALLARVREAALGAYAHQDLPFEALVEELVPERDLSRNPLVQVLLVLQSASVVPRELEPGLAMEVELLDTGTAKFDLSLSLTEQQGGLRTEVNYATDLFDRVTIKRLVGHFERLLSAIVEAPRRRITELPMLAGAERHALLLEWNDTATREEAGGGVHELVARQIARRPAAVAVSHGERVMTYGELGRRADRLARQLRRRVGPDDVVALFLERSPEMLVGMLGVLAAGGAYLPLDPDYPASRLSYMLADAGTWVVLTQEVLRDRLEDALPEPATEVIVLDPSPRPSPLGGRLRKHLLSSPRGEGAPAHAEETPTHPEEGSSHAGGPENLAYVIYTSGSTGKPKGVEIRHSGFTNLVRWYQRLNKLSPDDRVTQVAGPAFDGSVKEFWPILAAGGSLHLPDRETRSLPARLPGWLAREAITLSYLPTPLAEAVLSEEWPEHMALKALHVGGDRLRRRPGDDFPGTVFNLYGPTENTVVTTAGRVRPQASGLPAIGRPIANTTVYVVDRRLRPVPIGVTGELVTGGDGLARGYTRQPALTAERFVCDPWSRQPGARLYRTGDLVRRRPDGRLEFLARIDHQVKIRGYRIELGEIEARFGDHPAVAAVVVTAREEGPSAGNRRLVAYVVRRPEGPEVDAGELRSCVAKDLPDYMVPAAVVFLDSLPRTPSGKVDRKALPEPDRTRPQTDETSVVPRTPLEKVLARIWTEVLAVDRVGLADDFFRLGGHSLLAAQIFARMQAILGEELPLSLIFDASILGGFVTRVEETLNQQESGREVLGFLAQLEELSADEAYHLVEVDEIQAGETGGQG
ncbi:MAG: amino acid adenylation domain-containing protein, partial [bacterium]|nr:amino acid adenylation domain-containing protein [bacterium]